MRGDPNPDLGHIENLPHDRIARRTGCGIEAVTATVAHSRVMIHFLVRDRHLRQRRTRTARLLARLTAATGPH